MDYTKYLKGSGILNGLNESSVKNYFRILTFRYLNNELKKEDYASIVDELVYRNIFPQGIVIKELKLITLLEEAADLSFDDEDYEERAREYFKI